MKLSSSQIEFPCQVSGLTVPDPGICKLILPQRNNLNLYVNNVIDNSDFRQLTLVAYGSVSKGLRSEGNKKGNNTKE